MSCSQIIVSRSPHSGHESFWSRTSISERESPVMYTMNVWQYALNIVLACLLQQIHHASLVLLAHLVFRLCCLVFFFSFVWCNYVLLGFMLYWFLNFFPFILLFFFYVNFSFLMFLRCVLHHTLMLEDVPKLYKP